MDKPIKILHILGSANRGGTETNVYNLAKHMTAGFLNEFCFLAYKGPVGEDLEQQGFKVYYLPLSGLWSILTTALRLYHLLRTGRYDILQLYGLRANLLGRILGKLSGSKKILGALRSKYPSKNRQPWTIWVDRLTFALSQGYVSNSRSAIEFLVAQGYPSDKFWLIYNGIDTQPFRQWDQKERETVKAQYSLPFDKTIITCVANLRPPKNQEHLIRVLHKLRNEGIDFITLLVGDGPLRPALEKLVQNLNLTEVVRFLGSQNRDAIIRILAITDIFVLPSLWEGVPTAIMEAMAAFCPVVATAVGGVPELVIEGETGFLVDPYDSQALASRLKQLIRDPELRERMGKAARARLEENFTLDKMVQSYESFYKKLIDI